MASKTHLSKTSNGLYSKTALPHVKHAWLCQNCCNSRSLTGNCSIVVPMLAANNRQQSPCSLEGIRRAYPINCGVCSWYTAMNVPLFDGLQSYENIGPRRKHVKIINKKVQNFSSYNNVQYYCFQSAEIKESGGSFSDNYYLFYKTT